MVHQAVGSVGLPRSVPWPTTLITVPPAAVVTHSRWRAVCRGPGPAWIQASPSQRPNRISLLRPLRASASRGSRSDSGLPGGNCNAEAQRGAEFAEG